MRTEDLNPKTANIDLVSTLEALHLINQQDQQTVDAVRDALPAIAQTIDMMTPRLQRGGRLIYIGAGTSGRLGVLDAVECPPTFGVSPDLVQAIMAGGYEACYEAKEQVEDDPQRGAADLRRRGFSKDDVIVGLSASGTTLYTVGALRFARARGALTVAITCNADAEIMGVSDVSILLDTGPEAIAGSTRLKAGTAQKIVLNMLSTLCMIRLGYVYGNRMSHLRVGSRKLRTRAARIVSEITGLTDGQAHELLDRAGGVPEALIMNRFDCDSEEARRRLHSGGSLRQVLGELPDDSSDGENPSSD